VANSIHWLQVDLGQDNELSEEHMIAIYYTLRHNQENHVPIEYSLLGSVLGDTYDVDDDLDKEDARWFTIATFTKDDNSLPSTKGATFKSLFCPIAKGNVRYLRFKVTKTTSSSETELFWDLAEFALIKVEVKRELRDPEKEDNI
jgi:hypothetical protein